MSQTSSKIIIDDIFVSIIILNYNGETVLLDCVRSIYRTINCRFEIILVDNYSTDNSQNICKSEFPEIILIQNKINLGLGARNIGLEHAHGNFIVFLDSDTVVVEEWLTILLTSYQQNGEGLYQPKLLEKKRPDIINSAGNMINVFGLAYSRGKGQSDVGQYNEFQTISCTSGACTFMSSETMKKIGNVDSIFFAYHDDVDYGWRAQLLGIPSYYEPRAVVYHLGSPALEWSTRKFYLLERNRWICLLTLYSRKTFVKILPLLLLVELGMFFFFIKKGIAMTKIKSYLSLIKLRADIIRKKNQIIQTRKVSDKKVIKNFVDDFCLPSVIASASYGKVFNFIINVLSKQARKIINA